MFSESMLSMHVSEAEEPGKTGYGPALLAVGCAWIVALIRGIIGILHGERVSVDMALTAVIAVLVPLLVVYVWRSERRRSSLPNPESHRGRPRLVLVSGQPTRNNRFPVAVPIGNRPGIDACLTHGSLIKTLSLHAQKTEAGHFWRSERRS
jgi:hypothetical protein